MLDENKLLLRYNKGTLMHLKKVQNNYRKTMKAKEINGKK